MTIDAGHEDVDEASHDAAGVLDGLVAAQLDGAGAEELRVAAQVGHGRLEGDARAGGHLLEDHAQRLVLQQERVLAALLDEPLHGDGEVHHAEQLLLGEVVGVDVVLDHGNPPLGSRSRPLRKMIAMRFHAEDPSCRRYSGRIPVRGLFSTRGRLRNC